MWPLFVVALAAKRHTVPAEYGFADIMVSVSDVMFGNVVINNRIIYKNQIRQSAERIKIPSIKLVMVIKFASP